MHTITAKRAARAMDVSESQIRLWAKRDKLNSKTTQHGLRIHIDAAWHAHKRAWEAEGVEADPSAEDCCTTKTQEEVQARRLCAYRLDDEGYSAEAIADVLEVSPVTIYQYLRRRSYYTNSN